MYKSSKGNIAVNVSRLGADPIAVVLPEGSTVADALTKSGVTVAANAELFVDGTRAERNDVLDDKDILTIVTPKQAGSK